ncbi:hypothetical protein [Halomonas sp.]|uniref:hypothetical protein n=1 Tax=Halomonas sp. TaxID=1486246 RepID=UPI00262665EA|nr:hypothetical protein [Halomonas sp.]
MDFFTAQDRARRLSGRLVLLLLAVVALVVLTCVLVAVTVVVLNPERMGAGDPLTAALEPRLFAMVAGGVVAVVVLGGLVRHLQLRAGGSAVAEALGGRPLALDTRDEGERRLLIELSLPALRALSPAQGARFRSCLDGLMAAETAPGALQWALHRLVRAGLDGVSAALGVPLDFVAEPATAAELEWALSRLARLRDADRAPLVAAMVCCVEHDGRVAPEEAELLRAVAWSLGCPLPLGELDPA